MNNEFTQFITTLREDKNFRNLLSAVIAILDELDRAANDRDDAIETAGKIMQEHRKFMEKLKGEKEDNAALRAFIVDHVTDPAILNKIFN